MSDTPRTEYALQGVWNQGDHGSAIHRVASKSLTIPPPPAVSKSEHDRVVAELAAANQDAKALASDLRAIQSIINTNEDIFGICTLGIKALAAHEARINQTSKP